MRQLFQDGDMVEESPAEKLEFAGEQKSAFPIIIEAAFVGENPGPQEIPFERRVQMARLWIRMNRVLLEDELCLIDAHLDNFAFDDSFSPTWIDFGSVRPLEDGWEGLREFRATHLRPLQLSTRSPHAMKMLLPFQISRIMMISLIFGRPGSLAAIWPLSRLLLREDFLMKALKTIGLRQIHQRRAVRYRKKILLRYTKALDKIPNPAPDTGLWTAYRGQSGAPSEPSTAREKKIKQLVDELKPHSIIDVGANNGWVALQNLDSHRHICSIEPDHGALSRFTHMLEEIQLPPGGKIQALIGDFGERDHRHDLVVALALTHHLVLAQKWSFEAIADVLCKLSNRHVLIEFMPWGLVSTGAQGPQTGLPDWYSERNFLREMRMWFNLVTPVRYEGQPKEPPRLLYLCEK